MVTAVQVVLAITLGVVAVAVGLVVTGVAVLWGSGWALIAGGSLLAATAVGASAALLWGTDR